MKKAFLLLAVIALIGALPAQAELRYVHRASEIGGTGMLSQRIGDVLDPQEMNASIFVDCLTFNKLALNPTRISSEPYIDDPRGSTEFWTVLTYNYGINDMIEVGARIPFLTTLHANGLSDSGSNMRENGIGRIGIDGRVLILDPDRMGGGIVATLWLDTPSFQTDNSSREINGGIELNFTLKGSTFTNYVGVPLIDKYLFQPMSLYATMGYGYEDYLEFEKIGRGQAITWHGLDDYPEYNNIGGRRDPLSPAFVGTQVMYGALGAEFEVYDHLFVGTELLFRQYPDYNNDNNTILMFPEITYTYSDSFTAQAAVGFTNIENQNSEDDQPEMLGKVGITYHFPDYYKPTKTDGTAPNRSFRDLLEIFKPFHKPTPTEGR